MRIMTLMELLQFSIRHSFTQHDNSIRVGGVVHDFRFLNVVRGQTVEAAFKEVSQTVQPSLHSSIHAQQRGP